MLSLLQEFFIFLSIYVKLLDVFSILGNSLPEVLNFGFQVGCIIVNIPWIFQENDMVLSLYKLILILFDIVS